MNTDVLEVEDLRSVEEITAHQFKVRDAIHSWRRTGRGSRSTRLLGSGTRRCVGPTRISIFVLARSRSVWRTSSG